MKQFLALIFLGLCTVILASHYRAGEITYTHISGTTYEVTVTIYTKTSSIDADTDTITVYWGDGLKETLWRATPQNLSNDVRLSIYKSQHTYPGPALYRLHVEDMYRNGGINNIPNSDQISFFVESELLISPQEIGINNSPILTYPPIDLANINQIFMHNPAAYDPDGDSLVYKLVTPRAQSGLEIPGYTLPSEHGAGPENNIELNPITGELIWDSPQQTGEYNIAIKIFEYRNGVPISSIVRDMQITVLNTNNTPPSLTPLDDICIIAGENISERITASESNSFDEVTLSGAGGPFITEVNPATFIRVGNGGGNSITGEFNWDTECEHIRKNPYTIVFRAEDNELYNPLATIETWNIIVSAPKPDNLQKSIITNKILLHWNPEYSCNSPQTFRGYAVWKKEGGIENINSKCPIDLSTYGYSRIAFSKEAEYLDSNIQYGKTYCYRIQAVFYEGTEAFPYNETLSLPSEPVCAHLLVDVPLPLQVDILTTDTDTGNIQITWSRPLPSEIDTNSLQAPYRYVLEHSMDSNFNNPITLFDTTNFNFSNLIDTVFEHNNINTEKQQHYYRIAFYSNDLFIDHSPFASSHFIEAIGSDRQVSISNSAYIPWNSSNYTIFRREDTTSTFDSISTIDSLFYIDTSVVNEQFYQYYIQAAGSFLMQGYDTFLNRSQIISVIPIDSVPPEPPTIYASNYCNVLPENGWETNNFFNTATWTHPQINDNASSDISHFNIFFKEFSTDSLQLLDTVLGDKNEYSYTLDSLLNSVAGCFAVSATDSNKNTSRLSNIACVDNCPLFELPNYFTPNGDNINDILLAYPDSRFIEQIDLKIYDRWSGLVFETTSNKIEWDGTNMHNGLPLDRDVYFYVCYIYERRVEGIVKNPEPLKGYITLFK